MGRLAVVTVLAATASTVVACATATSGTGRGSAVAFSSPLPTPATSTSSSALPSSAPPPSSAAPSSSTAPSSSAQAVVTYPTVCRDRCKRVAVADVGGGYSVELALAPSTTGAPGTSVVILRKDGQLRYSRWTDGSYPGTLTCSPTPIANCVVVDGVGAHASQATGYRIENDELIRFDDVTSDTPVTDGIDLDGNGLIDIVTEVSTENPSYATGKRFWATLTSDGAHFSATGCSTPTFRAQPEPKQPLTGTCPQ